MNKTNTTTDASPATTGRSTPRNIEVQLRDTWYWVDTQGEVRQTASASDYWHPAYGLSDEDRAAIIACATGPGARYRRCAGASNNVL